MLPKDLFLPRNTYIIVPAIKVCYLDCEFEKLLTSEVDDDFRTKILKERKHLFGTPHTHTHARAPTATIQNALWLFVTELDLIASSLPRTLSQS